MLVVEFLKTHSLEQLEHRHGVKARIHQYKFSLNYDQIEARDGDRLAEECRGLVLRTKDGRVLSSKSEVVGETVILAYPMKRFYNYGQSGASKIDFASAGVSYFEKLDGTLIIVYFDDIKQDWCVATRSVCEANLPIDGYSNYTFRTLFIDAIEKVSGKSWDELKVAFSRSVPEFSFDGRNNTYCFELMTPFNQVVVEHREMKIALLTVREKVTGLEAPYELMSQVYCDPDMFNVPIVPRHQINGVDELVAFVNSRSGREYEGIVVCERRGTVNLRVKVKSAAYVASSRAKDLGSRPRNLLELILMEQIDDVLTLLTEQQQAMVQKMRDDLRNWIHEYDEKWLSCKQEVDSLGHMSDHVHRKQFVVAVQKSGLLLDPAMSRYEGKCDGVAGWIHNKKNKKDGSYPTMLLNKLLKQIGFGEEESSNG